jgi:phospholipase/carboxylesterase
MNRLQLWDKSQDSTDLPLKDDGLSVPASNDRSGGHHAIFAPLHYEPNYAYPLVVWLHGPNDNETQLQRVMPEISLRNYVGVGTRGNVASPVGFSWRDGDLGSAEQAVFDSIDMVQARFNIAPHRIFLAGFESGGSLAFRIGLRHPSTFAGVLSAGGPFPLGQTPLACLDQARSLPLFIAQGRYSKTYPVERTCDELRLFHSAGLSVSVRQYPCADELDSLMLRDMDAWIMERVTGIASDSGSDAPSFDQHLN